ncbi:hypothetical protein Tco_0278535 [Tanacetum coccineum]
MYTTRAQQQALDDDLVSPADRLKIGKSNLRLSSTLKSKEPNLQVALDALKLIPLYNAFEISTDVPEINMQEDMLKICPKLPSHIFKEPPLEEEILSFIRFLGHTGEIKFLSDVNVSHMHQPWRSFAAIINKCLSGKTTTLESLRLSRAQILCGMYHNKTVDYVYLLWVDLVYQVENKNSKKNNDMDDFMFTTIRVISEHQDTQVYGAILPQHLTNQAMLESEAYMTYHAYATGEKTLKPKSTKKKVDFESSPKTKLTQASKGKRINTVTKGDKHAKKKQYVTKSKGLTVLSEVALTEAEQIKLATKRSLIQTHSSYSSGSGADEGTEEDDDEVNVSKDNDDDDDDNDDDVDKDDEDDDVDNQDDEIPDDTNQDDNDEQDDEVNEEGSDDESNEDSDEEVQSANTEEEEMDEKATHEEDEANELYRDMNINLEGRDTVMIDAPLPNVQGNQSSSMSSGFVSNMLNPSPDTGIDTLFTPNTEESSLVDVLVTTIVEPPLLSATTFPPTPLITHLQQTPVPSPATVPSSSLQDLPNFGSLFGFDHRLKTLEIDFSEFKKMNQFAKVVSSIPGIVDAYLANKMHEAVKTVVQLQSERLRDEAQTKNVDFLNKLEDNIKKIIKDQVKEHFKAQFKRRRDDEDKDEEPSAGSNRGSKRRRVGKEPESTSAPKEKTSKTSGKSYEGSKSKHKTAGESAQTEEPMHTTKDLEEPAHQEFKTGVTEDQPNEETPQFPNWFQRPTKLPSPDRDWNKTLLDAHGPVQPWLRSLAQKEDPRESFNELMDTPLDFSAFVMNRLKVDTLTPELLTGLTFELMKGSCKSLVELEYLFEEVYKATTE